MAVGTGFVERFFPIVKRLDQDGMETKEVIAHLCTLIALTLLLIASQAESSSGENKVAPDAQNIYAELRGELTPVTVLRLELCGLAGDQVCAFVRFENSPSTPEAKYDLVLLGELAGAAEQLALLATKASLMMPDLDSNQD